MSISFEDSGHYSLSRFAKIVFRTPEVASHWFGYYNYSPISADGMKMLSHRVHFDGRMIKSDDTAEIGWFSLLDGSWHPVATTHAINWQQGAMLQWLGPDFQSRIIFNDAKNGHFISRIIDLTTMEEREIPWPVYGVSPDGKFSISLQFERSAWCRAYHYESIRNPEWNVPIPEKDGIFYVDLENGSVKRIISIRDVISQLPKGFCENSDAHWLEHIMVNPSATKFCFYHRYGQIDHFHSRAYIADVTGKHLHLAPLPAYAEPSHLGWKTDDQFMIHVSIHTPRSRQYVKIRTEGKKTFLSLIIGLIRRCVRLVIPRKIRGRILMPNYYVYSDDEKGIYKTFLHHPIAQYEDGHPSFSKDGKWLLTDTYGRGDEVTGEGPLMRCLLLWHLESDKVFEVGRFYSPFNSCGYRSDLHPRFSRDDRYVVIDSADSGRHQMIMLEIEWDKLAMEIR